LDERLAVAIAQSAHFVPFDDLFSGPVQRIGNKVGERPALQRDRLENYFLLGRGDSGRQAFRSG
jgi:hypothetical protein